MSHDYGHGFSCSISSQFGTGRVGSISEAFLSLFSTSEMSLLVFNGNDSTTSSFLFLIVIRLNGFGPTIDNTTGKNTSPKYNP